MMARYPVCCIAEMPIAVLNQLLNEAFAGSEELVPNSKHELTVITKADDGSGQLQEEPTVPPLSDDFNPFIAASIADAACHVGSTCYFAVLDQQSTDDNTALLVHRQKDGSNSTARVMFKSVQHVLIALSMASLGFAEIKAIAVSQGGIYGRNERRPEKGRPAPPMKLGRA
ncbi:hypothetical protein F5Y09DRAFT_318103 [Xylaria sp. FL1042]|nr:hypothetical protein F5Y09DRAFT_318103 [Xylaria sp. FL1042]